MASGSLRTLGSLTAREKPSHTLIPGSLSLFLCLPGCILSSLPLLLHVSTQASFPQGSLLWHGLMYLHHFVLTRNSPRCLVWPCSFCLSSFCSAVAWVPLVPSQHLSQVMAPDLLNDSQSYTSNYFAVVFQSLSHVWLFVTPWTAECQASLSFTVSKSLLKFMSIESVML